MLETGRSAGLTELEVDLALDAFVFVDLDTGAQVIDVEGFVRWGGQWPIRCAHGERPIIVVKFVSQHRYTVESRPSAKCNPLMYYAR